MTINVNVSALEAPEAVAPPVTRALQLVPPPVAPRRSADAQRRTKRALDLVLVVPLLVVAVPIILLLMLLVRLTSRGPAIFRQERIGQHGEPFTILKLRTMVADAEEQVTQLWEDNDCEGPHFKIRRDPRVTRVGHWLRRLSLDELPQLLNVLGGSMSLVGPRPAVLREVLGYDDRARRRLEAKPGLTGAWQVAGRNDLSWEESVAIDVDYVDHWSVRRDLGILLRTVPVVLGSRGAY